MFEIRRQMPSPGVSRVGRFWPTVRSIFFAGHCLVDVDAPDQILCNPAVLQIIHAPYRDVDSSLMSWKQSERDIFQIELWTFGRLFANMSKWHEVAFASILFPAGIQNGTVVTETPFQRVLKKVSSAQLVGKR